MRSVSGARLGVLRSACAKFGSEGSRKRKSRPWSQAGLVGAGVVGRALMSLCNCGYLGEEVAVQRWRVKSVCFSVHVRAHDVAVVPGLMLACLLVCFSEGSREELYTRTRV